MCEVIIELVWDSLEIAVMSLDSATSKSMPVLAVSNCWSNLKFLAIKALEFFSLETMPYLSALEMMVASQILGATHSTNEEWACEEG